MCCMMQKKTWRKQNDRGCESVGESGSDEENESWVYQLSKSKNKRLTGRKSYKKEMMYLSFKSMCIFWAKIPSERYKYLRNDENRCCQFVFGGADSFFEFVGTLGYHRLLVAQQIWLCEIYRKLIENLFANYVLC